MLETRARVLMLRDEYGAARDAARHALEEARAVGAEHSELRALNTLGFASAGLGEEEQGIAMLQEALERSQAVATPGDRVRAAINLAELLDFAGRPAEALDVVRAEAEAAVDRPERSSYDVFLRLQEVNLLSRMGRLEEARERLPRRVPGEAVSYTQQFWRSMRARIALLSGDLDALRVELEATERLVDANREPQWLEPYALNRAELALREDRAESARSTLERAATLLGRSDEANRLMRVAAMAERVEAETAGRARALGEAYEPVLDAVIEQMAARASGRPRFDEACAWGGMGKAEHERRRFLLGEAPPNPAKWLEVAAAFDAITFPAPAIYARYRAAEAFVAAGDHAAAVEPLRAACAEAHETGAKLLSADIASLARRARIDVESVDRVGGARVRAVAGRSPGAHPARARGAPARGRGPHEPGDRRAALHEREDRVGPRLADPRQARRRRPRRGRRGRAPARAHEPRRRLARAAADQRPIAGSARLPHNARWDGRAARAHLLPDPPGSRGRPARTAQAPLRGRPVARGARRAPHGRRAAALSRARRAAAPPRAGRGARPGSTPCPRGSARRLTGSASSSGCGRSAGSTRARPPRR